MTRGNAHTSTVPADLPSMQSTQYVSEQQRQSRRSKILVALHQARGQPLTAKQVRSLAGMSFSTSGLELERTHLARLVQQDLITQTELECGATAWQLTDQGRMMAIELCVTGPAPASNVAGPREHVSTQPMPRGEFRVQRAGAYDFERCPSVINGRRVWKDGRVEDVKA